MADGWEFKYFVSCCAGSKYNSLLANKDIAQSAANCEANLFLKIAFVATVAAYL